MNTPRCQPAAFIEEDYLACNPDVAAAVLAGSFGSAWDHFQAYGRLEGRSPVDPARLSRAEKALYGLRREGLGLEIGPSHRPLAPKKDGFNVHILDHLDAASLREKYRGHEHRGVQLENIEEVDFVWTGGSLPATVGGTARYDWIIASHVIEHVPDLVAFLQECSSLLVPDGRLSLVIPDRRFCFDAFSPLSTTGDVLDAHSDRRTHPTPGQIFDFTADSCTLDGLIAWAPEIQGEPSMLHTLPQAIERWSRATNCADYLDVHCWRFQPESFHLVLADLQAMNLVELGVVSQFPTEGCEFFASLGKVPPEAMRPINRRKAHLALQRLA